MRGKRILRPLIIGVALSAVATTAAPAAPAGDRVGGAPGTAHAGVVTAVDNIKWEPGKP